MVLSPERRTPIIDKIAEEQKDAHKLTPDEAARLSDEVQHGPHNPDEADDNEDDTTARLTYLLDVHHDKEE